MWLLIIIVGIWGGPIYHYDRLKDCLGVEAQLEEEWDFPIKLNAYCASVDGYVNASLDEIREGVPEKELQDHAYGGDRACSGTVFRGDPETGQKTRSQ